MADPDDDRLARTLWDFAHWLSKRVAAMPLDCRDTGFSIAERSIRDAARDLGVGDEGLDALVQRQLGVVRAAVAEIDWGGNPQSGNG